MSDQEAEKRRMMVEEQLIPRGIKDKLVLSSFLEVPRHLFVPPALSAYAYADSPLPIGEGQTISQPYIVALMSQEAALTSSSRVLEIGTGSGYAAAILAQVVAEVYTIERLPDLAHAAKERFQQLSYQNIYVKIGDGCLGWPEKGPFDAILVTAGAPLVPEALTNQLKEEGRLIIPVGDRWIQELRCYRKKSGIAYMYDCVEWVRFVPLIGEQGWEV